MIVWRDGKMMGILVDWDLCKYKEMLEKTTRIKEGAVNFLKMDIDVCF